MVKDILFMKKYIFLMVKDSLLRKDILFIMKDIIFSMIDGKDILLLMNNIFDDW